MTSGDGTEKTWREAAQAYRNAVSMLAAPAPELFIDLALMETLLSSLMLELPLVNFSPFGALTEAPLDEANRYDPRAHSSNSETSGVITAQDTGLGKSIGSLMPQPPGHTNDNVPMVSPDGSESVVEPPIFPLQRPPATRHEKATRQDAETTQAHHGQEEQTIANTALDILDVSESDGGHLSHDEAGNTPQLAEASLKPMQLLNRLADEALRQISGSDSQGISGASESEDDGVQSHPLNHFADSVTSGTVAGPSKPIADKIRPGISEMRGATKEVSENEEGVRSHEARPSTVTEPQSNQVAHDVSAVALIDSLAEHLLKYQETRTPETLYPHRNSSERMDASAAMRVVDDSDAIPHAQPSGAEHLRIIHQPGATASSQMKVGQTYDVSPDLVRQLTEIVSASGHQIDADALASLINDILVKQARRHGVDLS